MPSKIELKANLAALEELHAALAMLENAQGNRLIRNGLVKAARPLRRQLKQDVRVLRKSVLSTGTTERAISEMVRYPGSLKHVGGFKIGVALSYSETHFKTTKFLHKATRTKARGHRPLTGIVNLGRKRGKKRHVTKYTRSNKNTSIKRAGLRKPGKYWHLIHQGFKHRSGRRFPGYKFVPKAHKLAGAEAKKIFTDEVLRPLRKIGRRAMPR